MWQTDEYFWKILLYIHVGGVFILAFLTHPIPPTAIDFKWLICVFSIILMQLGGIALITLGSIVLANTTNLHDVAETNPASAAIALIVFGGVVFLISFFGCCGAIRESYCMTMTYATILLVVFIGQVVIAVLILVNKDDFRAKIMKALGQIWLNPSAPGNRETIEGIQKQVRYKWGYLRSPGLIISIHNPSFSSSAAAGEPLGEALEEHRVLLTAQPLVT